jgi:hypothetical protein
MKSTFFETVFETKVFVIVISTGAPYYTLGIMYLKDQEASTEYAVFTVPRHKYS